MNQKLKKNINKPDQSIESYCKCEYCACECLGSLGVKIGVPYANPSDRGVTGGVQKT